MRGWQNQIYLLCNITKTKKTIRGGGGGGKKKKKNREVKNQKKKKTNGGGGGGAKYKKIFAQGKIN